MKFTVKPATKDNKDGFEVVSEAGRHVEWFRLEDDARARADWLTNQYEWIMALL